MHGVPRSFFSHRPILVSPGLNPHNSRFLLPIKLCSHLRSLRIYGPVRCSCQCLEYFLDSFLLWLLCETFEISCTIQKKKKRSSSYSTWHCENMNKPDLADNFSASTILESKNYETRASWVRPLAMSDTIVIAIFLYGFAQNQQPLSRGLSWDSYLTYDYPMNLHQAIITWLTDARRLRHSSITTIYFTGNKFYWSQSARYSLIQNPSIEEYLCIFYR